MSLKLERREQKIFHRCMRSVEVCGRCGGYGRVVRWPNDDVWKIEKPMEETCPLCEGTGLVQKTVTVTTDLAPFRRE